MRILPAALAALALAIPLANAQPIDLPSEFYRGGLRQNESEVTFCLWQHSQTIEFDRAVGTALAERLLLTPRFVERVLPQNYNDDDFQVDLYVALADHCDVSLSVTLDWQPLPDWLTITRSYYDAPYLLVVTDPAYRTLMDIPPDKAVASIMFTRADMQLATLRSVLPAGEGPQRYPYDTNERALADLAAGRVAAALVHGPSLYAATEGDPAGAGYRVIPTDGLRLDPMPIGAALLQRENYLRGLLDGAIEDFRASGELAALLAEFSLPAEPR
ncbi:MAG: ABC transporter substrate-binding protein [Bauldia sp.]|nr:ABC transporter substrate-binding protein [Bauldia sp.]